MTHRIALALIGLSLNGCATNPKGIDGGLPDASGPTAKCPANVESSQVGCTFGADKYCTTYYGANLETCYCTCAGFWECDQVAVDCDAGIPVPDGGGDMTDMCLSMPVAVRDVPWDGDGGAPDPGQCSTLCEPLRPQGYPGALWCTPAAPDGGGGIACNFGPCGL